MQTALTSARNGINTQRATSLGIVRAAAVTRRGQIERSVTDQKQALVDLAEAKARLALQAGEDEARRALTQVAINSSRAHQIGEEKVTQFRTYDRANRIASVAREMAGAAATQLTREGNDVAATVRKDAADLAAKFRREAREAGSRFDEAGAAARRKVDDGERTAVEGINRSADEAITPLVQQAQRLTAQLLEARTNASAALAGLGPAASTSMAQQATRGEQALDQQQTQAHATIDAFCADVSRRLSGASAAGAAPVIAEADAHLGASLAEFDASQQSQVAEARGAFDGAGSAGQSRISAGSAEFTNQLIQSATTFETTADGALTRTTTAITGAETTATTGMTTVRDDLDAGLARTVREAGPRWDGEIAEGRRQMAGKVTEALSAQDRALRDLGNQISTKAEEIEHESWWERALGFIGGIIVGIFEEIWDLVKGLLIVLLVILVLVVVVLIIAVIIAAVVGGFEGLLLAAAFVMFMVEVAEAVLVVLAVIGIIVAVAIIAWRVYQAWTRDDLSDYERGKLIGRSITDILSFFVPGRVLARIRGWLRLRQLARMVGGDARLVRLLTWAGGDLAAIERLAAELRSLDEFELLLTRTASLEEFTQLRRLCNGDLALTLRMLGRGQAAEMMAAIGEFANDAAFLDRILTEVGTLAEARRALISAGNDVGRLRRWVTFFDGVRPMDAMLTRAGREVAVLDDLVANTANPTELTRLMNRLGGNAPVLRDLLLATDDVAQLDRMLSMLANDGVELRRLLRLAGGRPAAGAVEILMRLARSEGRAVAGIEGVINQAGGNVATLNDIARIAQRFAGRLRAPANMVPAPGYAGADLQHFLIGHTYSYFDFATAGGPGKTFWPPGGPGGDLARVQADLNAVLGQLSAPGSTVRRIAGGAPTGPPTPTPVIISPPGIAVPPAGQFRGPAEIGTFQFGTRGAAPYTVGQFFPRPGAGFEHHSQALLRAIREIMAIL